MLSNGLKPGFLLFIPFFIIVACHQNRRQSDDRTVFRYNESSGITSLDPAFASNQANIWAVNQLYNGLVQLDDRLEIMPCVASDWRISVDGMVYTFFLRDDVFFHDYEKFPKGKGRKVTAHDFVYSFNRIVDPNIASPGSWIFNHVKKKWKRIFIQCPKR